MIKPIKTLFLLLVMAAIIFPPSGFSEDKGAWLHAGPLSDTAETIQRKADLKGIEESLPKEEPIIADRKPILKKEPFSFKSWLKKILGYDL